ncbi:unnamed protein product [Vitrella brassicaformis CCMP3155]|uniref:TLDc domain-containing protein n=1 Tax=Vitrella brassicaformis (strain CCMP3155) TaxID=1169540 RepID=A0A0G4FYJ0_VITBC|nr:unnamed protein product [Vitrella brassicaformis CCMP3155]|eukprot:CEM20256.1 unnamed protein product [Vitrella brassicaformis CCMP3155]
MMTLSLTCVGAEGQQVNLRRVQVSPPGNTSLSAAEHEGLLDLMGNDNGTKLNSVYRTSVHGTTYDDLLDSVGDAEPLVFVIRKDQYVFGAFINCGLELPDDPTDYNGYDCDLWHFSLAGHFPEPTKIEISRVSQRVRVAGREGTLLLDAKVMIGRYLLLGVDEDSGRPAADIRSCYQFTWQRNLPAGYTGARDNDGGTGVRNSDGDAFLGGSAYFHADEIEVLHVMGNSR